jgi:glucosylceramidase
MAHFSKYIRPGAKRIGLEFSDKSLLATAAQNSDGTIAVVILNQGLESKTIKLKLGEMESDIAISAQAIQTIIVSPKN